MKKIDIVFTKSKKKLPLGSWAIRLWTWKSYSHVARKLSLPFVEKSSYFHANEGKVNYEYETWFLKDHIVVKQYRIEVPDDVYSELSKHCWSLVGQSYGTWQNVGIILVDILKLFKLKIKNPWKHGVNCSELLYITIFKPMFPELKYDPDTIKPHHIEKIIIDKYS